ncbi:hypothetical protein K0M31_005999 [Melipona bicolor]|uniref:Uncharacterized protein n=1 Tax=Melipona bicolor TaxID=60889 RepID=A0AA40FTB7_9HYME|nr:hypothetical protein K0M31_005999 [Melipona bicolor]
MENRRRTHDSGTGENTAVSEAWTLSLSLEERYAAKWHELSRASTRWRNDDNDDNDDDLDDDNEEEQVRVEREGLAGARDGRVGMRERAS